MRHPEIPTRFLKRLCLPVSATVIGGLILQWLKPGVFNGIWTVLKRISSLFVVDVTLPVWGILILASMFPALIGAWIVVRKRKKKKHSHLSYIADTFYEIVWTWQYAGDSSVIFKNSITPRCPVCKCILQQGEKPFGMAAEMIVLECPHCDFKRIFRRSFYQLYEMVFKEVERKLVTGEYKAVLKSPPL